MFLKFISSGYIYIAQEDDCHTVVDNMLRIGYKEDYCIAESFDPEFVARLMEAGFLVMSADINEDKDKEPKYILLPKLHNERSALFFENLQIKKSIRRLLNRYELRPYAEFNRIISRCVEKHGAAWLTPPLVECIKKIRDNLSMIQASGSYSQIADVYPASFALYRDGELVAGEFGVVCGKVYTSYSGFYDESNAGTVQLILTTRYLQEHGFLFFDLGMPMDYKNNLGAVNITPEEFVSLFRS